LWSHYGKQYEEFSKRKKTIEIPHDPAVLLLGAYQFTKILIYTFCMFTASLFTKAKIWKHVSING